MNQETYICSQFANVLPTSQDTAMLPPHFTIRMKIQSNLGETNYINLTEDQFREIECILAFWESNRQDEIYVEKREYNPDNYRGI